MKLSFGLLALLAALTATLAQQEQPQIAPQSAQYAPHGRSAPLLGVRYSASTDVSKVSFNSPLVTYGDSLNEIQLPAAPIKPSNLRQAPQEDNSNGGSQEEETQTLVRSGNQVQDQLQAQDVEPQSQVTQAIQPQLTSNQQQYISIQQYPARPQLKPNPRGFSLNQNLPGPQPQVAARYASQYQPAQLEPQIQQPQYATAQQQYAAAQPQYATAQPQYATGQPQYTATQPIQYASTQPQFATAQPQQYSVSEPQGQYPSPVSYSSSAGNTYFATGPFAAQYPSSNAFARQYPAQLPAQYAQPTQYSQQTPAQYAQVEQQYPAQSPSPSGYPSAPAQVVSRVAFNGPVGGFSYSF